MSVVSEKGRPDYPETLPEDTYILSVFGEEGLKDFDMDDDAALQTQRSERVAALRKLMAQHELPCTDDTDFLQGAMTDMMTMTGWFLRKGSVQGGISLESLPDEKFFLLPPVVLLMCDAACQYTVGRIPGMLMMMTGMICNVMIFGPDKKDQWLDMKVLYHNAAAQHDHLRDSSGDMSAQMKKLADSFYGFLRDHDEKHIDGFAQALLFILDNGNVLRADQT